MARLGHDRLGDPTALGQGRAELNPQEALLLVRKKFLEEQRDVTSGPTADQYKQACQEFPAVMTTAHHLWAREFAKGLP